MTTQSSPPPLPSVPLPDPARLPTELRDAVAWIVWRAEWVRKRFGWKLNKVPCDGRGMNCSMTAAKARGALPQAVAVADRLRKAYGPHFGVGVTMCAIRGIVVLDLDDDLVEGPSTRLQWLMEQVPTWAETSVSGKGAHLFLKGTFEGKRKIPWRGSPLEIFGSTGFVAITANLLSSSAAALADGAAIVTVILAESSAAGSPAAKLDVTADPDPVLDEAGDTDADPLRKMFSSKNGTAIRELWGGSGPEDQSAGDLALCNHLRFWVGRPDAQAIDRLFRQSGRMRAKWDERHSAKGLTYGQMTIEKAQDGNAAYRDAKATRSPSSSTPNARAKRPPAAEPASQPATGARVILDHFRNTYKPQFRRGNCIFAAEGREVRQAEATTTPTSALIDRLATATDAPRYESGEVKRSALPRFFSPWAKTAWGDLLDELPTEDDARLGGDGPARDEFRRLVTSALLTEIVLGSVVRGERPRGHGR